MPKLQLTFLVISLGIAQYSIATACSRPLYYLDGVDRRDAMNADIDLDAGFVRVASDRFDARKCSGGRLCMSSGYLTFSSAPSADLSAWSVGDVSFSDAGRCVARSKDSEIEIQKVASRQKYGEFEFYYDPARNRLIGWSLRYVDLDGRQAVDVWMLEGFSGC